MAPALHTPRTDVPAPTPSVLPLPQPTPVRLPVPRLSVVLVNYCQWENTAALIRQLGATGALRNGTAEVMVVDNHSPRHRVLPRLRRWPGVSLRRWGRNRGFARAVNEGCRLSRGEWFLLLNPDMSVPPGFLESAWESAERLAREHPNAGVIGFQLRNSDGSRQYSTGPLPTFLGTLARLVLPRWRRKYHLTRGPRCREVPWVTGCCLLVRRACFEQIGGMDSRFFLYYEDVDFCQRARAHGWSVWHEPCLRLTHHRPLQGRSIRGYMRVLTRHALLTYARKHWAPWETWLLTGIVGLEAWFRQRVARWRGQVQKAERFAVLQAIARDFRSGDDEAARRRLRRLVRQEERRRLETVPK